MTLTSDLTDKLQRRGLNFGFGDRHTAAHDYPVVNRESARTAEGATPAASRRGRRRFGIDSKSNDARESRLIATGLEAFERQQSALAILRNEDAILTLERPPNIEAS